MNNTLKKNFFKKISEPLFCLVFMLFCVLPAYSVDINCIDIPTAEVVDYSIGEIGIRLYNGGGTISRIIFAPFNRFNFGGSIDIDQLIGKQPLTVRDPKFYFKWRIFDGSKHLPALAIGYDGQGYEYDPVSKKYLQPEKGLFLVFTSNIIIPGLFVDFGSNVVKYMEENKTFAFLGVRYTIEDIVTLIIEYDNIGDSNLHKINAGFRVNVSENLNIDLSFKNFSLEKDKFTEEVDRQVGVKYYYKFF